MALLSLSDRQRGEVEGMASHTPLAKERCRAQALLWIAEGFDVAEVAELLHASWQTISNWLSWFQARAELAVGPLLVNDVGEGERAVPGIVFSNHYAQRLETRPKSEGLENRAGSWSASQRSIE